MAYNYDKQRNAIYMSREAYNKLRQICDEKLLRRISVADIRYDYKLRHIVWRGYDCMLEISTDYVGRLRNVIKSDDVVRKGTLNPVVYDAAPDAEKCMCDQYHYNLIRDGGHLGQSCYKKLSMGCCTNRYLGQTVGHILFPCLYPKQKQR